MRKLIDFLGGCCVTLFFLVTYLIMGGINFYKDHVQDKKGFEGSRVQGIKGEDGDFSRGC